MVNMMDTQGQQSRMYTIKNFLIVQRTLHVAMKITGNSLMKYIRSLFDFYVLYVLLIILLILKM